MTNSDAFSEWPPPHYHTMSEDEEMAANLAAIEFNSRPVKLKSAGVISRNEVMTRMAILQEFADLFGWEA